MKTYTVNKGKHKSTWIPKFWYNKNTFNFEFSIEEGWFNIAEVEHSGISKICGISSVIHAERILGKIPIIKNIVNGVVIGWYPSIKFNKYDLYIITDYKGVEKRINIASCTKGEKVRVRIRLHSNVAYVTFNDIHTVPVKVKNFNMGYYLFPYFGGKAPAYDTYVVNLKID